MLKDSSGRTMIRNCSASAAGLGQAVSDNEISVAVNSGRTGVLMSFWRKLP